jgi:hypothetical protein
VHMRRCACRHGQARACMRATARARVRCSVRDGVRARRHTADASRASRQSHLTASPVYESSEGGEESAYDDRVSLEHLCGDGSCACTPSMSLEHLSATCRAARMHIEHPITAASRRRQASLASLAVLALAPHTAVGADGGAARHAGRQPSPADLVGQAVRLRGLPQASPQVCKGVAYCSKDSGSA